MPMLPTRPHLCSHTLSFHVRTQSLNLIQIGRGSFVGLHPYARHSEWLGLVWYSLSSARHWNKWLIPRRFTLEKDQSAPGVDAESVLAPYNFTSCAVQMYPGTRNRSHSTADARCIQVYSKLSFNSGTEVLDSFYGTRYCLDSLNFFIPPPARWSFPPWPGGCRLRNR